MSSAQAMVVSGECNLLGFVSSQQRFEAMDVKALGVSQLLDSPCYSSWTDQFYLENISSRREGMPTQRREEKRRRERENACVRRRERPLALWLLFLYVFSSPLDLPYVNWASQECRLFCLRSSLWSSDLPLTFHCSIFAGFSLPCLLATNSLGSYFLF